MTKPAHDPQNSRLQTCCSRLHDVGESLEEKEGWGLYHVKAIATLVFKTPNTKSLTVLCVICNAIQFIWGNKKKARGEGTWQIISGRVGQERESARQSLGHTVCFYINLRTKVVRVSMVPYQSCASIEKCHRTMKQANSLMFCLGFVWIKSRI